MFLYKEREELTWFVRLGRFFLKIIIVFEEAQRVVPDSVDGISPTSLTAFTISRLV